MGPCRGICLWVQFESYQCVKKVKQVASSTQWRSGENVVLPLMECLLPFVRCHMFINSYFTSFHLLTNLEANNIRAIVVLNKKSFCKCRRNISLGRSKIKECDHFEQSWKRVYSRTRTKLIALLQPEYVFFWQNGPEHCQVQDWYLNEKMVVVPVCLNGWPCSSECVSVVLTKMKTMSISLS